MKPKRWHLRHHAAFHAACNIVASWLWLNRALCANRYATLQRRSMLLCLLCARMITEMVIFAILLPCCFPQLRTCTACSVIWFKENQTTYRYFKYDILTELCLCFLFGQLVLPRPMHRLWAFSSLLSSLDGEKKNVAPYEILCGALSPLSSLGCQGNSSPPLRPYVLESRLL